jgi:anti-sigma B factor antagonist
VRRLARRRATARGRDAVVKERTVAPLLRTTTHDGRVVVHCVGELDLHTVAPLRRVLERLCDAGADVVVDLTRVTFVDSTGLGVLVGALRRTQRHGGRLVLVVDRESVMKVFRITSLARVFTIHRSLEAALAD